MYVTTERKSIIWHLEKDRQSRSAGRSGIENVDYSKDPEIQQLYTRLVNGRSQFGQILAKNASASLQIAEVVDAVKSIIQDGICFTADRTGIGGRYAVCVRKFARGRRFPTSMRN